MVETKCSSDWTLWWMGSWQSRRKFNWVQFSDISSYRKDLEYRRKQVLIIYVHVWTISIWLWPPSNEEYGSGVRKKGHVHMGFLWIVNCVWHHQCKEELLRRTCTLWIEVDQRWALLGTKLINDVQEIGIRFN